MYDERETKEVLRGEQGRMRLEPQLARLLPLSLLPLLLLAERLPQSGGGLQPRLGSEHPLSTQKAGSSPGGWSLRASGRGEGGRALGARVPVQSPTLAV